MHLMPLDANTECLLDIGKSESDTWYGLEDQEDSRSFTAG